MHKGEIGEGYLLGGENISIRELIQRIARLAGDTRRFRGFPVAPLAPVAAVCEGFARLTGTSPLLRRGLVRSMQKPWAFSSEKAQRVLGYTITPFEESLKTTFESA